MLELVPSKNRSAEHSVVADFAGSVWCDCPAAKHDHPCSYAGAAFHRLRQMSKACRQYRQ